MKAPSKCTSFWVILPIFLYGCGSLNPYRTDHVSPENINHLIERGNNHWDKRINPKDARKAALFLSKALSYDSHNIELTALFSRACYFNAANVEQDRELRDREYSKGFSNAWQMISKMPAFQVVFDSTEGDSAIKNLAAIAALPEDTTPLLYWYCANLGRYLASRPVIERLGHREILEAAMHRVLAVDPDYFFNGPFRFFGAFYARLPGVELSLSEEYFEKAIQASPEYLDTYVLRARYLYTKTGELQKFVQDLNTVINADPAVLPEVMPENLLAQERAEELLTHTSMLFE